jgi:hypothetical protein
MTVMALTMSNQMGWRCRLHAPTAPPKADELHSPGDTAKPEMAHFCAQNLIAGRF